MGALIVYYSRTDRTKKIAEAIQSELDCEIERIQDTKNRKGIIGWLSAERDAEKKATTKLESVQLNPSDYNVVIIGSPTWNGHVSVPIRSYILKHQEDLTHVGLFSTGDVDRRSAVEDMKGMLKKKVFASMHLIREKEIDNNKYSEKVETFVEKIKSFML